jgi:hypothetical protein
MLPFDPSELGDFANIVGVFQRKDMLRKLEQRARTTSNQADLKAIQQDIAQLVAALKAAEEHQQELLKHAEDRQRNLPQCPACGGRLEGHFSKCMHCASDLVWVAGSPCEPAHAAELREKLEREREILRQQTLEYERRQAEPDLSYCGRCHNAFYSGGSSDNLCPKCGAARDEAQQEERRREEAHKKAAQVAWECDQPPQRHCGNCRKTFYSEDPSDNLCLNCRTNQSQVLFLGVGLFVSLAVLILLLILAW